MTIHRDCYGSFSFWQADNDFYRSWASKEKEESFTPILVIKRRPFILQQQELVWTGDVSPRKCMIPNISDSGVTIALNSGLGGSLPNLASYYTKN